MDSSSSSSSTTPGLCARGCGFFGTAENRGMCSKCHTLYLKELVAKSEAAVIGDDQLRGGSFQSTIEGMMNGLEIDKLANTLKSATLTPDEHNNNDNSLSVPVAKKRCGLCRKRVGLVGFECRCGATFCGTHRYPEAHSCGFNYKRAGKIAIRDENPVCKSDKINDRV